MAATSIKSQKYAALIPSKPNINQADSTGAPASPPPTPQVTLPAAPLLLLRSDFLSFHLVAENVNESDVSFGATGRRRCPARRRDLRSISPNIINSAGEAPVWGRGGGGERLHAWGDTEIQGCPSFGAFGVKLLINYQDLSEDPSEIHSCKTRYSVTDVRG